LKAHIRDAVVTVTNNMLQKTKTDIDVVYKSVVLPVVPTLKSTTVG
jgi:hypothetical protein